MPISGRNKPKDFHPAILAVRDTLNAISGKWKLLILISMNEGHCRFGEIEMSIPKITPKVLSQELRELEKLRFIKRSSPKASPGHNEYSLTPHFKTLKKIIREIKKWGVKHSRRKA